MKPWHTSHRTPLIVWLRTVCRRYSSSHYPSPPLRPTLGNCASVSLSFLSQTSRLTDICM